MKTGTAEKILKDANISISRSTLLKDLEELKLGVQKNPSDKNIFRWKHIAQLR